MGGRSSLPTARECSNNDSSGPLSLLWSPWLELGATNDKVLVLRLNTSPELISKFLSASKLYQTKLLQFFSHNTFLTLFPFPQWIPWSAFHLNDSSPGKYLSSLSSLHWVLLKDCLGLFGLVVIYWATYSDPTFLGDHDPKCREVATCNIGSVWGCCHLSFSLHLVPSTSLTNNLLLTTLPCCCLQFLFINNKIFWITFHFCWLYWVISSYLALILT